MSNTITACENVCQDFYWLWSLDPRIVQGFLTVVAATIGASVALHISKSVYPVQKDKDREIKIDEEKRAVFRDYLKTIDVVINQRLYTDVDAKLNALLDCKSALNEALLFSSQETATIMWDLYYDATLLANSLGQGKDSDFDEDGLLEQRDAVNASLKMALNAARGELGNAPVDVVMDVAILKTTSKSE